MKIKSLVILLIGALIFSSCSKDEQHKYSCDENVNEFVSENKEVLATSFMMK